MPIYPYSFQLPPLNVQDIPNDGVPGEFLGISAGGALDWLPAGGGGSGDMLAANNLSELTNFATARTNIGLGTTSTPTFANLTLTSPSLASSAPVTISQTWNNAAVTFTGLKVDAISTNSALASKLLDLQLGGVSQFNVDKGGTVTSVSSGNYPSYAVKFGSQLSGIGAGSASGTLLFWAGNAAPGFGNANLCLKGDTVHLRHAGRIVFGQADFGWGAEDTILLRDGAPNTLALRNGAAAQTFNVYGTYTSAASYARLAISCDTSGNATLTTQSTGVAGTVSINGVPVGLGRLNFVTNLAIGVSALASNTLTTLGANVAVGDGSLTASTQTYWSTAIGYRALAGLTGFSNSNVAVGYEAGAQITSGANSQCSSSVFIGHNTKALGNNQNNQIVIGASAIGIGDNSVVLGNDSITKTALKGNVGIGTTAPTAPLEIRGAAGSGNRESLLKCTVSDSGNDAFHIYNATSADNRFSPGFSGSMFSSNVGAVFFTGQTDSANDTGNSPLTIFSGRITSSQTDPNNGILSAVTTRPLFAWWNLSTAVMQLNANGNLGIGTTSPTSKLHVVGDARITTDVFASAVYGFAGANTTCGINGSDGVGPIIHANQNGKIGFFSGTSFSGVMDTVLVRDGAANTLALRNGAAAQMFRVYNTYSDGGVNYERTVFGYGSNQINLGSDVAGSGVHRKLNILGAGIDFYHAGIGIRWSINASGHFIAAADYSYDIGASGANRPRTIYVGTSVNISGSTFASNGISFVDWGASFGYSSGSSYNHNSSNKALKLTFGGSELLQFGGTSASFPAIKRSTTYLQARLSDDSAFAPIQGKLTTDTAFTATTVVPTGFITLYDSTGTAYKVPCVPA